MKPKERAEKWLSSISDDDSERAIVEGRLIDPDEASVLAETTGDDSSRVEEALIQGSNGGYALRTRQCPPNMSGKVFLSPFSIETKAEEVISESQYEAVAGAVVATGVVAVFFGALIATLMGLGLVFDAFDLSMQPRYMEAVKVGAGSVLVTIGGIATCNAGLYIAQWGLDDTTEVEYERLSENEAKQWLSENADLDTIEEHFGLPKHL